MTTPIEKLHPIYNSIRSTSENYCISECSYLSKVTLCEGASVMLLKNFAVEFKLINDSVGIIRIIVYANAEGPESETKTLPAYVVIEFKNLSIPDDKKPFPNFPNNYIPISIVTD